MEKITKGHPLSISEDILKSNIETLKRLFPTIVKEGKIDMKELEALLSDEMEHGDEYYRFTWAGKSEARREANKPSTATLRPDKPSSKDWDTTQNIFIEGDNLEVLKLLQKSYSSKIKMIYIDPPYNTGNDFVYNDDYVDNLGNYLQLTKQVDTEGRKINANTESDGRYHSNWLTMMYPRLKLARNLLKEDGVIFISIDENEVHNLRKLCDEIFGEGNFMSEMIWKNKTGGGAKSIGWITLHEYILCYCKDFNSIKDVTIPYSEKTASMYKKKDEKFSIRGPYATWPLDTTSMGDRPNLKFPILYNGKEIWPEKQWLWSKDRVEDALKENLLEFNQQDDGSYKVRFKGYLKDENGNMRRGTPLSIFDGPYTQEGSKDFQQFFSKSIFTFPKPVSLLNQLFSISTSDTLTNSDIILDFFAGSGTTAQAAMQLNAEDGGNRKVICVQLPEPTDESSEAFKAGYKTIAEITKERIRRAGDKIKAEQKQDLFTEQGQTIDIGFKAFKLDSSNIAAWDGSVENFDDNLFTATTNIKPDRTAEDVLYEVLLKYGLDLTVPIEEKQIDGQTVYSVGLGALFVCVSDNITTEVAEGIGKWKEELNPTTCRVLFRDNGFKDDVAKTNSIQILKRYGINEINSL